MQNKYLLPLILSLINKNKFDQDIILCSHNLSYFIYYPISHLTQLFQVHYLTFLIINFA
jgi:hypothetical protein